MCLSLALLTGCITPLTGKQKCALVGEGEVYTGSSYGSQLGIVSAGAQVYPYTMTTVNPRCRLPQTPAERAKVDEIRPEAQQLTRKNQRVLWSLVGGGFGAMTIFLLIVMP